MAENKKISITGEVKIDQAQAQADVEKLNKEFAEFKTMLEKTHTGIELILRSLSAIAQSLQKTASESKEVAETTAETAEALDMTTKATEEANKAAEELNKTAKDTTAAVDAVVQATDKVDEKLVDAGNAAKDTAKAIDTAATAATKTADKVEDVAEETKPVESLWKRLAREFVGGVVDGVEKTTKETERFSAQSKVATGFWERMGHRIFDGIMSGIKSIVSYFGSLSDGANEVNTAFGKLAASGVKNIDALKVEVADLAGELRLDKVDVTKAVEFAESMGSGAEMVNVAAAALRNYKLSGMDVNRQIEISARVVRAFNAGLKLQPEIINAVAAAAKRYQISQDELWSGVASLAPKLQALGGSFRDLLNITQTGLAEGLKAGGKGLEGLDGLFNRLINPTREFGEALVDAGVIVTQSSAAWQTLRSQVDGQRSAFDALNNTIDQYRRKAEEIGLLTSQTEQALRAYEALNDKVESGTATGREKSEWRERTKALKEQNAELAAYDKIGNIVSNREFRSLSLRDQVTKRLEAARLAQEDYNIKMREAQLESDSLGNSLQGLEQSFAALTARLETEVPAAIQAAISGGGLSSFVSELASIPEVLAQLPASVQTAMVAFGPAMSSMAQSSAQDLAILNGELSYLKDNGVNAFNELKINIETISQTIFEPFRQALDKVSARILTKLKEPFSDNGKSMYKAVSEWANETAKTITTTFDEYFKGDITLKEALKKLFTASLDEIERLWQEYGQKYIDALQMKIEEKLPAFRAWLIAEFTTLGKQLLATLEAAVQDFAFGDILGAYYGQGGAQLGPASYGVAVGQAASVAGKSATYNNTYNVNGAGDPGAVANKIMQYQAQQERLGNSGSRLR